MNRSAARALAVRVALTFALTVVASCAKSRDDSALDNDVASVSVTLGYSTLGVGRSTQALAAVKDLQGLPADERGLSWYSTNPNVATVSATSGLVTAKAPGTANIVATIHGQSGSYRLSVVADGRVALGPPTGASSVGTSSPSVSAPSGRDSVAAPATSPPSESVASSATTVASAAVPAPATAPPIAASAQRPSQARQARVSHDFNDGTFGPFVNSTPGHNSIIDDPTGSGRGKVVRIRYEGTGGKLDLNQYFQYEPPGGLSAVHFGGDFYFPPNTVNFDNGAVQRKLIYWRMDPSKRPQASYVVIHLWGESMDLVYGDGTTEFNARHIASVRAGVWHRLELDTRLNSVYGASDGVVRLWVDGRMVFEKTDARITNPAVRSATPARFDWFGIGYQREGMDIISRTPEPSIDEVRYWDNIVFSPLPGAP